MLSVKAVFSFENRSGGETAPPSTVAIEKIRKRRGIIRRDLRGLPTRSHTKTPSPRRHQHVLTLISPCWKLWRRDLASVQQLIREPRPLNVAQKRSRAQPIVQRHVTKLSHQVHRFSVSNARVNGQQCGYSGSAASASRIGHRPFARADPETPRPLHVHLNQRDTVVSFARRRPRVPRASSTRHTMDSKIAPCRAVGPCTPGSGRRRRVCRSSAPWEARSVDSPSRRGRDHDAMGMRRERV